MSTEKQIEMRNINLPMLGVGSDLGKLLVRAAGLEWGKDKVRSIECRVATSEAISFKVELLGRSNAINEAMKGADELSFPEPEPTDAEKLKTVRLAQIVSQLRESGAITDEAFMQLEGISFRTDPKKIVDTLCGVPNA